MTAPDPRLAARLTEFAPPLTALRCAFLLAAHHGIHLAPEALPALVEGDMAPSVLGALRRAGFRAALDQRARFADLARLGSAFPVLARTRSWHWLVLVHAIPDGEGEIAAVLLDPRDEARGVHLVPRAAFEAEWDGTLLLARPAPSRITDEKQPFGLRWFVPELLRQRRLLAGVAFAALIGNLIAFAIPLLLQVLIDRVIAHEAWNTLAAVVAIFVTLASFDAVLGYVRQRLTLIAGGKIDARLGARAFAHLLALPMSVFENTASGVLARHMQQTEKLRQFLTGRLMQVLLDAALLPVLIVLLLFYSGVLTAVVLGFALLIAGTIAALLPLFRRRLSRLYLAEAERQAALVETLHNMRAVKALVLEPARRRAWDTTLASAVRRQWAVGEIGALAQALNGWLEKLAQITVLALGAMLVFEGRLSIGALVAFTMLSAKVTGPLIQIVGLISEYQETLLSARMLASVMDHPVEAAGQARPARPEILGHLVFEDAGFTWPGAPRAALDALSFEIRPGQVIGVVGRSGSGKTTLTRLIQGIETPGAGRVLLDGVDIRHIDLAHLRKGVGVVLQENLLFRGSLRENIAAARPEASLEEVVAAARLSGADEFIARMPMAYETRVEEGGANLSGGQRQRIAIARALLTAPRVLVLDEATSALDPESEALVNRNLAAIAHGRTMIVVSHRLSSLVRADMILVLDQGRMVDFAPHSVLLGRSAIYRGLWAQQTEHVA